jgi:DNA-binding CsgD family transcriptional regulator
MRQTLMVNDARSVRPHLVTVIPFDEEEPTSALGAIVFAQRCEPSDEVFTGSLRQLFRLSAAETAIAAALVSGADVEQIAEMRNAKITTVRTQIAAMLLKTRTRRQGELVAMFSRICGLP